MRSDLADFELVTARTLAEAHERVAAGYRPIAGGTDVMVMLSSGKLAHRRWVDVWGLGELRFVRVAEDAIELGALTTYTDVRRHPLLAAELPMLVQAASETGGIAIQNRGTLGGNIVNASPAADSLPALLVYEAELLLISARGPRRIPYGEFHTGYKQTKLEPDEIISGIVLQPRFAGYYSYSRKVGTRNAQAIAKLCVAGLGRVADGKIEDVRLAIGSMAVTPVRLRRTEEVLLGRAWTPALVGEARQALETEVAPIDDIRSSAVYRLHVAGNLLQEFLEGLFQ